MQHPMHFTSSVHVSSLIPGEQKSMHRTKRAVAHREGILHHTSLIPAAAHEQSQQQRKSGYRPAQHPPTSKLNESTLLPLVKEEVEHKYHASAAYQVHSAGNGVAHVTGGKQHIPSHGASRWVEPADAAGQSSRQAARQEVSGSRHFFGQHVYDKGTGGLAPFHGIHGNPLAPSAGYGQASELGGRPASRRGRREVQPASVETEEPLTPGRVLQSSKHRMTFDSEGARSLISGGEL